MEKKVKKSKIASHDLDDEDMEGAFEIPKFRQLGPREAVSIAEFGVDGIYLRGTALRVAEYSNGQCVAIIPGPKVREQIRAVIFLFLVTRWSRPLAGRDARYVRRFLEETQEGFAVKLGLSRETVTRFEKSAGVLPAHIGLAIQQLGIFKVAEVFKSLPASVRKLNKPGLSSIQEWISRVPISEKRYTLRKNLTLEMEIAGDTAKPRRSQKAIQNGKTASHNPRSSPHPLV